MRVPKLSRHKTGQAFARFGGKCVYFGKWPAKSHRPPPEVQQAYGRHLEKWLRTKQASPKFEAYLSIYELWEAYLAHIQVYYLKDGKQTTEVLTITQACRIAARLFGEMEAEDFGPVNLREVREEMLRIGWARQHINKQVGRVRGMFKWAASHQLIPVRVLDALRTIEPLKKARTAAREEEPILPVDWATVEKTLPHLSASVADMVRVHYLIGCRSQDIVIMRPCDIRDWVYRPPTFKTQHLDGAELLYHIGPKARAILAPIIERIPSDGWMFPASRRGSRGDRSGRYSTSSYRRCITRACERKKIDRWFPLQIRHTRLTDIRHHAGIEAAQAVAGHTEITTTQIYAARSSQLAKKVMDETG